MFTNRPAMKRETTAVSQKGQTSFTEHEKDFYLIRDAVQQMLLSNNNGQNSFRSMEAEQLRSKVETCYNQVLEEENILYNHSVRQQMLDWVIADILGYGPIEPLLSDPDITEIMVNGHDQIYVERFGLIEPTIVKFEDNAHLMRVIDRIVSPIGRRVDESSPMVERPPAEWLPR